MTTPFEPYFGFDPLARDPLRMTRNRLLARIIAPSTEPLTLAEAKLYLRIDHRHEDTLLTDLIVAVRMIAESWMRCSLITQSWKLAYDGAIPISLWLPMGPVGSITGVVIVNQDTTTTTVDPGTYWLNAAQNAIVFAGITIGFRIEISYSTGYGAASDIPRPIKHVQDSARRASEPVDTK